MEPFTFLFKSYFPPHFYRFLLKNQQPGQDPVVKHQEEPWPGGGGGGTGPSRAALMPSVRLAWLTKGQQRGQLVLGAPRCRC